MQEWLEENDGISLLETLYKALDEVSSTLYVENPEGVVINIICQG